MSGIEGQEVQFREKWREEEEEKEEEDKDEERRRRRMKDGERE